MTKCGIEFDKKVYFCFIKLFRGVATNLEFFLHIIAEKIFVWEGVKANVLCTLNWFIDRIFFPIPLIR